MLDADDLTLEEEEEEAPNAPRIPAPPATFGGDIRDCPS